MDAEVKGDVVLPVKGVRYCGLAATVGGGAAPGPGPGSGRGPGPCRPERKPPD